MSKKNRTTQAASAVALWLLLLAPLRAEQALITNQLSDNASWLGGDPVQALATIDLALKPVGVAICGDSGYALVTSTEVKTLSLIDLKASKVLKTRVLGKGPFGVDCDDQRAVISDWYNHSVALLSLPDMDTQATIEVGQSPAQVLLHPSAPLAYVANRDSDSVMLLDLERLKVKATASVGDAPFGLALSNDGEQLAAVNVREDSVSLLKADDLSQSRSIAVGARPYCAVFSKDAKRLYISNQDDDTVSVVDTELGKEVSTIDVGSTPEGVDLSADGQRLWVVNWGDASVSIIDTQTLETQTIELAAEGSRAIGRFLVHEQRGEQ